MQSARKFTVLFVCMGNICRSPTAEGVFRKRVAQAGLAELVEIDSAGTHAYHIGEPPDRRSQQAAAQRDYDLSRQRARKVEAGDFEKFDLVLAMDHDNLALLNQSCPPHHAHKLALLMQFAATHASAVVPDPYYGGDQGFDTVLDYIEDASDGLIALLHQRLRSA